MNPLILLRLKQALPFLLGLLLGSALSGVPALLNNAKLSRQIAQAKQERLDYYAKQIDLLKTRLSKAREVNDEYQAEQEKTTKVAEKAKTTIRRLEKTKTAPSLSTEEKANRAEARVIVGDILGKLYNRQDGRNTGAHPDATASSPGLTNKEAAP